MKKLIEKNLQKITETAKELEKNLELLGNNKDNKVHFPKVDIIYKNKVYTPFDTGEAPKLFISHISNHFLKAGEIYEISQAKENHIVLTLNSVFEEKIYVMVAKNNGVQYWEKGNLDHTMDIPFPPLMNHKASMPMVFEGERCAMMAS